MREARPHCFLQFFFMFFMYLISKKILPLITLILSRNFLPFPFPKNSVNLVNSVIPLKFSASLFVPVCLG
jgi:hypothetical protein